MKFSLKNPRHRQWAIIGGVLVIALVGVWYLFFSGSGSSAPESTTPEGSAISQEAVKSVQKNITILQEELKNSFYANLKKVSWIPDDTQAGNKTPFVVSH